MMGANSKPQKVKVKTLTISPAQELNVDVDLRRLHEACAVLGDYIAPFARRIKLELQRVRDGEQPDVPTIPLFVYGAIPFVEIKPLFLGVLSAYPYLRTVQLHHCALGDDGILTIVEFIRLYRPTPDKNPFGIQCLEAPGCLIGPVGAKYIGNLLSENDTITRCVLDFNPLGDSGAQALANGVRWNGNLEELSLQHCAIESAGAEALAHGVLRCSNVRTFSLRGNAIGPVGISHIGAALCIGNRIECIDIADTRFGWSRQAVETFCHGAESSTTLTSVDMDFNVLNPEAAPLISTLLAKNKRLVQFRVNERMEPNQYLMIQNALEQNNRGTKRKKKSGKG